MPARARTTQTCLARSTACPTGSWNRTSPSWWIRRTASAVICSERRIQRGSTTGQSGSGTRNCAGALNDPGPDPSTWRGSDWARRMIHHPEPIAADVVADYPSHGHIDLLEQARGRGIGRKAMTLLMQRLSKAGSKGMFLDVHPQNLGARAFYAKLGFAAPALDRSDGSKAAALGCWRHPICTQAIESRRDPFHASGPFDPRRIC